MPKVSFVLDEIKRRKQTEIFFMGVSNSKVSKSPSEKY